MQSMLLFSFSVDLLTCSVEAIFILIPLGNASRGMNAREPAMCAGSAS